MTGFAAGLFVCMAVIVLSVIASVVASYLLHKRLRQRSTMRMPLTRVVPAAGAATPGATVLGDSQALLSAEEGLAVRGLVMRTVAPRPDELVVWARQKWPAASREELARRIVSSTAEKCGFIGFVTGAPGLFAMPVTLPIDIIATGRLQATMVQALAYLYEVDKDLDEIQRQEMMIMVGGGSLARSITQLAIRIIGPSVLKVMPVVGAFAGYAVNYGLAQALGRTAIANFSGSVSAHEVRRIVSGTTERLVAASQGAAALLTQTHSASNNAAQQLDTQEQAVPRKPHEPAASDR